MNYTDERNRNEDAEKPETIVTSPLTCKCASHMAGVLNCESGRKVVIKSTHWAGNFDNFNIPEAHQHEELLNWTEEDFHNNNGSFQTRENDFATALCSSGLCSKHGGEKTWILNEESPCDESLHRTGVLCGACIEDYRWNFGLVVSSFLLKEQFLQTEMTWERISEVPGFISVVLLEHNY